MAEKQSKTKLPPYVSFGAFESFINKLRDTGVPGKVDRSLMPSASGSLVSALQASLRSLGMIDDQNRPTAKMTQLVEASDEDRKPVYKSIVDDAYAFLFDDPQFDLTKATTGQVADKFREQDITGSTVSKSIGFFLAIAKAADVKVSVHVKAPPPPRGNGAKKVTKAAAAKTAADLDGEEEEEDGDDVHRFEIPIPGKSSVKVIVPSDLDAEDWEMLQSVFNVYVQRWKGFKKPEPA